MSIGVQKKSKHPLNYHENGINNYEKLPQENTKAVNMNYSILQAKGNTQI